MQYFKYLLHKRVDALFLVVWPPMGEEKISDVDMSFGFVFENELDKLYVVGVDEEDVWTPCVRCESLPVKVYSWEEFPIRMSRWMKMEEANFLIEMEYYDLTNIDLFGSIVFNQISAIELIGIEGDFEPFGIKILFDHDYVVSTPISDGATVETAQFNRNNNIDVFENLGKVIYKKIA